MRNTVLLVPLITYDHLPPSVPNEFTCGRFTETGHKYFTTLPRSDDQDAVFEIGVMCGGAFMVYTSQFVLSA